MKSLEHDAHDETIDPAEARQRVLRTVAALVREVIGEEWAEDVVIGMDTSFASDLELESIEFVALAERLKVTYGKRVDFPKWLASMDLKRIIGLKAI